MPLDRETILEEALRVFARHGVHKTSISDIVRAFGVGKTAIYHHFPGGKAEIIESCLEIEEEQILSLIEQAIAKHEDPRDQLRDAVLTKLEYLRRRTLSLEFSKRAGRDFETMYREHERRFTRRETDLIESILRRGGEMGVFRRNDPRRDAQILRGIFGRFQAVIVFDGSGIDASDELDTLLDLIFHGLLDTGRKEGSRS